MTTRDGSAGHPGRSVGDSAIGGGAVATTRSRKSHTPGANIAFAALPADPREVFSRIAVVALPMVTRFRGITTREAMLVEGPAGWAEFSPFVEYAVPEASRWLAAALEHACTEPPPPQVDAVPVNGTIPACPPGSVAEVAARYSGVCTFKIKVAEHGLDSLAEDCARIEALRTAAPGAQVRLDANGRYTVAEARTALRTFSRFELDYIEQPVMDVEDLARVREDVDRAGLGIRIAADESIRKASDPLRVAALGAADVIIVKVQPLGGVRAALNVIGASGLPAVVSSALDTSVGLSAGVALAASLPARARPGEGIPACGLGTSALFRSDVADPPLRVAGGVLPVGRVAPAEERLSALAAAPDRVRWWMDRLQRCWDHLRTSPH